MPNIQYFLGANSPRGFYSLYDQLLDPESASAIYILKGGPGCGKSTLMKQVSAAAQEATLPVEHILCSGDPDSLDAVLLPTLKIALVDGTAPHVVEPKYPGVVERYVNLGECYDCAALTPFRTEISALMAAGKNAYARAYRCLDAAAHIQEDMRATLLTPELEVKLQKRATGILSREVRRIKGTTPGQVTQRFLGANTHKGQLTLFDTAQAQCSRIYELSDSFGLAHTMLAHLLAGITAAGHNVVACPSPMAPDRLEHLIVPDLSLAFLSCPPGTPFPCHPCRRIRVDAMVGPDLLRHSRPRLRFSKKVVASLMEEAISSLAQAKALHDKLEAIYNPHVDFERVTATANSITQQIFG